MQRRRFALGLAVAAGLCSHTLVRAHTPYTQWTVYRRKHLLVGCQKDIDDTYKLAKSIVRTLDTRLPKASARVARAPNAQRIASLMATDQLDVTILNPGAAIAMADGSGPFAPYGPIALRRLVRFPQYLLVARADLPDRHAWLIADALVEFAGIEQTPSAALPWHAGAERRHAGDGIPE